MCACAREREERECVCMQEMLAGGGDTDDNNEWVQQKSGDQQWRFPHLFELNWLLLGNFYPLYTLLHSVP